MTAHLVDLLIRFLVFGLALGLVCWKEKDVQITPRWALPLVAGLFALLNALLYTVIATAFNVVTLFAMWFAVPFVVNGLLLLATDKVIKQFKINSIMALLKTAGALTAAHLLLHLVPSY